MKFPILDPAARVSQHKPGLEDDQKERNDKRSQGMMGSVHAEGIQQPFWPLSREYSVTTRRVAHYLPPFPPPGMQRRLFRIFPGTKSF